MRASIAIFRRLFEFWGVPILSNRAIGLRKVDDYECYDSFDWEVQCLSKASPSFRFLHRELGISVRPYISRKEVLLDPFGNSFFLAATPS